MRLKLKFTSIIERFKKVIMLKLTKLIMQWCITVEFAVVWLAAKIIPLVIPFSVPRKCVRRKLRSVFVNAQLEHAISKLREKKGPIKVGFLVVLDSCFQMNRVYELMREDKDFCPQIVVVPDVARGITHQKTVLERTCRTLKAKYGDDSIYVPFENGKWIDISKKFDVIATMCPYSSMVLPLYRIFYLASKGVLVCYSRYYTFDDSIWGDVADSLPELSFLWRFYAESADDRKRLIGLQNHRLQGNRIVSVGCPKLDNFSKIKKVTSPRKRVIIAPHHSVLSKEGSYSIGNFLFYADLILRLPQKYPQIDWIFRPHPLLFPTLVLHAIWTQADVDAYVSQMESYPNCVYQRGGDYFETFVNSDAMIQDCGSFLPEYFYVDHPQLYVIRSEQHIKTQYKNNALTMLEACETASSAEKIYDFIERVVLRGEDGKREARRMYFEIKLKRNFPFASEAVVEDIKKSLGR